jgi:hypothetical protein
VDGWTTQPLNIFLNNKAGRHCASDSFHLNDGGMMLSHTHPAALPSLAAIRSWTCFSTALPRLTSKPNHLHHDISAPRHAIVNQLGAQICIFHKLSENVGCILGQFQEAKKHTPIRLCGSPN